MSTTLATVNAVEMNAEQFREYRAQRDREIVNKYGKTFARKYWQAVDRLFRPADVVEYRGNGVVTKSTEYYQLQVLGDTDSHHGQWRVATVIDVSDQFATSEQTA